MKKSLVVMLLLGSVVLMFVGCATSQKQTEIVLTGAGFRTVPVSTAGQQKLLTQLPPGKISKVVRNDQITYVYPDHSRKVLFVGSQVDYEGYHDLIQDERAYANTRGEAEVRVQGEVMSIFDGAVSD